MRTHSPYPMIPVAEALARVLAAVGPLDRETIPAAQALGRTLAAPIHAAEPLPAFSAATVDGFAVRAADGAGPLRVVGARYAGEGGALPIGPGECTRIMTGAPLPEGADAVMMVEFSTPDGEWVTFNRTVKEGDYLRPVGSDIAPGERLLTAGQWLGAAELGLLATVGATTVEVTRRPVVGVMSTGDELVPPDAQPAFGQIRDSNRPAIMAAARAAGAEPLDLGIAPDEAEALERFVRAALPRCDFLVTSGGVSMGERDLVKPLLAAEGTLHFGRVNLKPGKPATFGTLDGVPFFGLPGNPVSSLVSFELFVRPALRKMAGLPPTEWARPRLRATMSHAVRRDPGRDEFQRATLRFEGGRIEATITGRQASSRLLSLVGANALLHFPAEATSYAAGDEVEAWWMGAG